MLTVIIPAILVGIPLGAYFIRRLDAETFRRICMSFDAWVVGFGLSRVLIELKLLQSPWAYGAMAGTVLLDVYLLSLFFSSRAASLAGRQGVSGSRNDQDVFNRTDMARDRRDPFGPLGTVLGFIIAILGVAILVYASRLLP